jgi:hypothetical protein
MSRNVPWRRSGDIAGGRLDRPGGKMRYERLEAAKEGAHGGTMGSPMQVRFLDV